MKSGSYKGNCIRFALGEGSFARCSPQHSYCVFSPIGVSKPIPQAFTFSDRDITIRPQTTREATMPNPARRKSQSRPYDALFQMIVSKWIIQALGTVVELDVPDPLAKGARQCSQIARQVAYQRMGSIDC